MRRPVTTASRWTAAACVGIGLLFAWLLGVAPSASQAMLEGALVVVALVAGFKMWLHHCFESHFVAAMLSIAVVAGVLLSVTAGPPGVASTPVTVVDVLLLACAAAIPVLLHQDARARRTREDCRLRGGSAQVAVVVQQA